jgi:hypothetical protein
MNLFARRFRRLVTGIALLLPLGLTAQPVHEHDLKAAFVYNFALFTDWPADTIYEGGTLNICINPASALRPALNALRDKPIRGRRIALREPAPGTVRACHVLFLEATDRRAWPQMREALAGATVLTVADDQEPGLEGSIIMLGFEGNRIVFSIDTRAAGAASLILSSKLLRLAAEVR